MTGGDRGAEGATGVGGARGAGGANARRSWLALAVVAVAVWCWLALGLGAARIGEAPANLAWLAGEAWPPQVGEGGVFLKDVLGALLETVQMAFLATLFGAAMALPLAFLSARNLSGRAVAPASRLAASAIRVLPSLVWAILAVIVFGPGPLAGVVAMTLYTVGYLSKLQYEALEGIPRDGLEAVRAMGATRFQQAWHVALPEAGNALRSQLLFMLEYNVRASSIIGIVGAGGIGHLLAIRFRFGQWGHVLTIVVVLFVTVALLDLLSLWVRSRYVEVDSPRRPRWRDTAVGPEA